MPVFIQKIKFLITIYSETINSKAVLLIVNT